MGITAPVFGIYYIVGLLFMCWKLQEEWKDVKRDESSRIMVEFIILLGAFVWPAIILFSIPTKLIAIIMHFLSKLRR